MDCPDLPLRNLRSIRGVDVRFYIVEMRFVG